MAQLPVLTTEQILYIANGGVLELANNEWIKANNMETKKKELMATDATLRDYFAAYAISNPISPITYSFKQRIKALFDKPYHGTTVTLVQNVEEAYRVADEMIKQRSKKQ